MSFGDEHNQISILRWTEEHQGYENAPRQQAVEVDENIAYHSPCRFPENESEPHSIWRLGLPESIDMFLIHVEFLVHVEFFGFKVRQWWYFLPNNDVHIANKHSNQNHKDVLAWALSWQLVLNLNIAGSAVFV